MERSTSLEEAHQIMSNNFIGPIELESISSRLDLDIPIVVPTISYSKNQLQAVANTHILILGVSKLKNGKALNIHNLKSFFGEDPEVMEPCFYNQDWYNNENFIETTLETRWYLLKKDIFEDSRAVNPNELEPFYDFPSAILCAYVFFIVFLCFNEKIWYHDFVWCSDRDHNGDRIYVGKYHDIDGINKNGFSIHRHLALRSCYGAVSLK
jgi:hypothetical protein